MRMMGSCKQAVRMGVPVLLAGSLLVSGCSSDKSDGAAESPGASTGATAAASVQPGADTKDFVTVNWYMRKAIDNVKDQEAVEAEANKIIKEKINANLHINMLDNASWEEKMKVMAAAGEAYDLVLTSSWTNRFDMNVQRGAFLPLDDLLKKYGQDILKKVDPRAWKAVTVNGKIMAVPNQTPYSQPSAFVFKKDLVDKYKFDTKSVKTVADLEPFLETIKKNEPDMTPYLAVGKTYNPGVIPLTYTEIVKLVYFDEKTEKLTLLPDAADIVSNYRKLNDYYKKGYIAKDAAIKTDMVAEAKSGKYAVMRDSGGYTEDGSKSSSLLGFPTYETLFGYPPVTTGSMLSVATAISKTSKNPERAMMLLNLVWQDKKLSNTLAYGIEDKNYTVTSGKGTDNPTVKAKSGAEQTWAVWHNWLGPLWDQWDSNWNTTKALEDMKKNNDTAPTSKLLGFSFNPDPVSMEVAQLSAVASEIMPIMYAGSMNDFDSFMDEMKKKMKNAGVEKVQAEIQKQIDEWKKQAK